MRRLTWVVCVVLMLAMMLQMRIFAESDQSESQKRIVLTFDDGPHPRQTRQILDVLDQYGIKATFFVIGINAKNYPGIVEEVLLRGHEIGNHTNTHSHAAKLDAQALERQILDCEQEVWMQTGKSLKLFRPPEGAMNERARQIVRNLGYVNVLWTLDTRDWAHTPPEQISKYITENAKNGDIILMHDYIGANSPTVQALELFIPALLEKGFVFVTAGELLENK